MADEQDAYAEIDVDSDAEMDAEQPEIDEEALADDDTPETDDEAPDDQDADDEGEESEEEGEAEQEELEVIEFDGKQYQVPKELKGGFLMEADYRRKTQEVADQRRQLESREAEINQKAEVTEEDLRERGQLHQIDEVLSQYEQMTEQDWRALQDQDPMGAQEHWRRYEMLGKQKTGIQQRITEREQQKSQEAQQDLAKRLDETAKFAQKEIKGWSPELDRKLVEYARGEGIPDQFLRSNMSPTFYKVLHRAWLGEQALAKQTTAVKRVNKANPKPQATRRIKSKTNPGAGKSVNEMNMDEYVAFREKQEARQRGR